MKRLSLNALFAATAAGALFIGGSPASAEVSQTYLDLSAGAGYSTNPFLRLDDDNDGAFARLSAYAAHSRVGERGSTTVTGFVENSTYFEDSGSKQIFSLDAFTRHQASERVSLFGGATFSGDLAGQLSNRFVSVPPQPEVPDPQLPPPVTVEDPDLFAFTGRQYRLRGFAGSSFAAAERSSVTVSAGAERIWYTDDLLDDYTILFASGGYSRLLSERTTVGARVNFSRADFDDSDDQTTIINPELTVTTQLAENWDAAAAVGVTFSDLDRDGDSDSSTNLSLNGSLCRRSETESLCGRVMRISQTSAAANLVTTTSAGLDWYKRLDESQTVQLSASAIRYSARDATDEDFRSHHFRLAGNYDRKIGRRFSVGASLGLRQLRGDGPDPDTDVSGSVYLRYRIGDLT